MIPEQDNPGSLHCFALHLWEGEQGRIDFI